MSSAFPPELDERYERLGLLGKGGMGTVFRARDRELGREVAIKVLHLKVDATVSERFRREAEVLADLRHPHIIEVYDHGVAASGPFIVMELLEGSDLEVPPPDLDPLEALLPIAEALELLHARGLVHRDVKPANLFRTRDGRCVLMDFGLIYVEDRTALTQTGAVSGTISHMSPETMQLAGAPAPPADWWALGVTLYTLYEKQLPYTVEQVLRFATHLEVPPLELHRVQPDSPPGRVLQALLSPDPKLRPRSRAALEAAAQERAPAPPPPRRRSRLSRTHLALASGAITIGLLGGYLAQARMAAPGPSTSSTHAVAPSDRPRFGEDFLEMARRDLRAAEHLAVAEDWRIVSRTSEDAWLNLTDLDPLAWGPLWSELEHLVEFHAWLAEGGAPEDLDEASLETLRRVDELHSGQLLPAPFAPLLAGPTDEAVPIPHAVLGVTDDPMPLAASYSGWLGSALRASRALHEFEEGLQADVDASVEGRPTSENFPRSQGLATTVWRSKVSSMVETHFLKPADRRALRRWFAAGMPHLRRLHYCLGRAVRAGEPHHDVVTAIADRLATRSLLLHSELAHLAPRMALGIRPEGFPARAAHLALRTSQVEVLHRTGMIVDPSVDELLAEQAALASQLDPTSSEALQRWALLVRLRLRLAQRQGTHDAILSMVADTRERLDQVDLPRLRVRVASVAFELWDEVGPEVPLGREARAWVSRVLRTGRAQIRRMGLEDRVPEDRLRVLAADY